MNGPLPKAVPDEQVTKVSDIPTREHLFLQAVEAGTLVPNLVVKVEIPLLPEILEAVEDDLFGDHVPSITDGDGIEHKAVAILSREGIVVAGLVDSEVEWVEDTAPEAIEEHDLGRTPEVEDAGV